MSETEQTPNPRVTPDMVPIEAHIVALRAELVRTQLTLRLATGALLGVALLLAWQALRGAGGAE